MLASETSPTILKIVILLKNQWEEEGRSGEGYLQFFKRAYLQWNAVDHLAGGNKPGNARTNA